MTFFVLLYAIYPKAAIFPNLTLFLNARNRVNYDTPTSDSIMKCQGLCESDIADVQRCLRGQENLFRLLSVRSRISLINKKGKKKVNLVKGREKATLSSAN